MTAFNRFPGPGDLPGDPNNPNSPDYIEPDTEVADELRDELESLPEFIHEAMGELSPTALAAALDAHDERELMVLVRDAVSTYADHWIKEGDKRGETLAETLRRLVRTYRPRAAA